MPRTLNVGQIVRDKRDRSRQGTFNKWVRFAYAGKDDRKALVIYRGKRMYIPETFIEPVKSAAAV